MSENFHITDTNPNDEVGGGGCVCSDSKQEDCQGPYAVFYSTTSDNNLSPHVVLSLRCAEAFVSRAKAEQAVAVDTTAVELPSEDEVPV